MEGRQATEYLRRIQVFIEEHLADPALTPQRIGRESSSRPGNCALFARHGLTANAWIKTRRLEACPARSGLPRIAAPIHHRGRIPVRVLEPCLFQPSLLRAVRREPSSLPSPAPRLSACTARTGTKPGVRPRTRAGPGFISAVCVRISGSHRWWARKRPPSHTLGPFWQVAGTTIHRAVASHQHHQPAGGRITTRRLTTSPYSGAPEPPPSGPGRSRPSQRHDGRRQARRGRRRTDRGIQ